MQKSLKIKAGLVFMVLASLTGMGAFLINRRSTKTTTIQTTAVKEEEQSKPGTGTTAITSDDEGSKRPVVRSYSTSLYKTESEVEPVTIKGSDNENTWTQIPMQVSNDYSHKLPESYTKLPFANLHLIKTYRFEITTEHAVLLTGLTSHGVAQSFVSGCMGSAKIISAPRIVISSAGKTEAIIEEDASKEYVAPMIYHNNKCANTVYPFNKTFSLSEFSRNDGVNVQLKPQKRYQIEIIYRTLIGWNDFEGLAVAKAGVMFEDAAAVAVLNLHKIPVPMAGIKTSEQEQVTYEELSENNTIAFPAIRSNSNATMPKEIVIVFTNAANHAFASLKLDITSGVREIERDLTKSNLSRWELAIDITLHGRTEWNNPDSSNAFSYRFIPSLIGVSLTVSGNVIPK